MGTMLNKNLDRVSYSELMNYYQAPLAVSVYGEDYRNLVFSTKQDWLELVGRDGRQFWFHIDWSNPYPPPVAGPFSSANLNSPVNTG